MSALPGPVPPAALLEELCAISSESGNADGLRRVAARLAAALAPHGLTVELLDERDAHGAPQPVLVARGPAVDLAAGGHLLLLGHLDTVLSAAPPRRDGEALHATGALDMKGGLAALAGALDLLAAEGRRAPRDLVFVGVPDEESEGAISVAATRRYSAGARAVLVLEPGAARGGGETLVVGRRGLAEWSLSVRGRASHSGLAYWEGRSAVAAASDFAARAQGLSVRGPGRTVNVARIVGGGADFVDALAANAGLLGTARQLNVVADRAAVEGEVRALTEGVLDDALLALESLARDVARAHDVALELRRGGRVPPVDPNGPGRALALRAVELAAARGVRLELEEDRGGVSFPNFLAEPGRVPVLDGLGPVGDGMHTREEWLDLGSLARRARLLADLLATL